MSSYDPTGSLYDWYKKLKEYVSAGDLMDERTVREKYQAAVEVLRKPPKDWNAWLNAWEEAMSEGIKKNLPEISRMNV